MQLRQTQDTLAGRWTGIALALALLPLGVVPLAAQQAVDDEQVIDDELASFNRGGVLYFRYCANCHGEKGLGDGRVARLLTVEPTDLTTLAAKGDGTFPEKRVRKSIDGRSGIRGHGMRDMPIWGEVFQAGDSAVSEQEVQAKIEDLLTYLRMIQKP